MKALRPLAELFTLLETAPWSGEPYNSANPKANMLTHAFGERGLATYIVLERQRETYLVPFLRPHPLPSQVVSQLDPTASLRTFL
ncbi:hypothetical protein [Nonomuraea sp. NPDC059022]|uniref:hypothetical protein n=1 Tax=Nonomuraea sp. NPDC059022 TaxID=3346705 RepID=UPI003677A768